jgi:hypothetical protein
MLDEGVKKDSTTIQERAFIEVGNFNPGFLVFGCV